MSRNTALVLIGYQEVRTDKKSDFYLRNLDVVQEKVNYLIEYARHMDYKIIFVKHIEPEGAFSIDAHGSEIMQDLIYKPEDEIIIKHKVSSFYNTKLETALQGVENIVVGGLPTNLCVRSFIEEAYDRDYNLVLIEDICQTYSDKLQEFTLDDLHNTRPAIDILTLDQFLG